MAAVEGNVKSDGPPNASEASPLSLWGCEYCDLNAAPAPISAMARAVSATAIDWWLFRTRSLDDK